MIVYIYMKKNALSFFLENIQVQRQVPLLSPNIV